MFKEKKLECVRKKRGKEMSLIDELKDMMQRASIPETKSALVIFELTTRYGGQKHYVRHNIEPNCKKQKRKKINIGTYC